MPSKPTINDLPDEMLELIVQHLDWYDRQSLSQVSERMARLGFDTNTTVLNVIAGSENDFQDSQKYGRFPTTNYGVEEVYSTLLASQRSYKHVVLWLSKLDNPQMILQIVDHFHRSINTLRLICGDHEVDMAWVANILQLCPNLCCLDIKSLSLPDGDDGSARFALEPMSQLRTLYAQSQVLNAIPTCSAVFSNVTSLHVIQNPPKELIRTINSQLVELTLTYNAADQVALPEENFPCLETLKLKWKDRKFCLPLKDQLKIFMESAPKLKALIIEPLAYAMDLLEFSIQYPNIQHLEIYLAFMDEQLDDFSEEQPNLLSLCLWGVDSDRMKHLWCSDEFVNVHQLRLVCRDMEDLYWIKFVGLAFPTLKELDVQHDGKEARKIVPRIVKFAQMTSRFIPSLRRLHVDLRGLNRNLMSFTEFCASLTVQELSVQLDFLDCDTNMSKQRFKQAPSIRNLTIRATRIDPSVFVPMLTAMPAVRRLELQLGETCSSQTTQMIMARFPRCEVVRKRYQDSYVED